MGKNKKDVVGSNTDSVQLLNEEGEDAVPELELYKTDENIANNRDVAPRLNVSSLATSNRQSNNSGYPEGSVISASDQSKFNDGILSSMVSPNTVRNADADINIKTTKVPLSPRGDQNRTFMNRTFGKLEKGSVRGSIFSLCSAAVGGGVLSLPYMLVLSGWATGVILLLVGSIAAVWSNLMLARLATDHKLGNLDQVALKAGGKFFKNLLQCCMLGYLFICCIGYQIILNQLLGYVWSSLASNPEFSETVEFRAMVNIPAAVFVFGPLTSMRDMSSLQFSSVISLTAMCYTSLVLIAECPYYYKKNVGEATIKAFVIDSNFFTSCSLTFFSFTCQVQILPLYSELINPQYRRIKKVVVRSIFVDFLFYVVFAVCGYASTFNYTNSIAIERENLPNYSPDYTMLVAAASISLVVFGALPLNANPCRNQFFLFFFKNTNYSQKANYIWTVLFIGLTCTFAILVPNISSVLSIAGGLFSTTIAYFLPMFAHVKLSQKSVWHPSNLITIIFFSTLIFCGYASVVVTVIELIYGKQFLGDRPDIMGD